MKRVGIIGIGNPLMGDDGVGVEILKRLRERDDLGDLTLVELGSGGMELIHHLSHLDRVLIVDSAHMEVKPGEFRIFTPEDIKSVKFLPGQSLHEFDVLRAIELSQQMGERPDTLLILAIQPESLEWGEGLSESLAARLEEYELAAVDTAMKMSWY